MSLLSALAVAVCELTGLMPSECAHCLGNVPDDADPVRTSLLDSLSDWVCADHPGRCVVCGNRFPAGAAIAPEGEGWRADCCPRTLLPVPGEDIVKVAHDDPAIRRVLATRQVLCLSTEVGAR